MSAPMLKALESRAEVDSLEALQQERRSIVQQIKKVRALNKTFDARRKNVRGVIAADIEAKEGKMAETTLDRKASGDERYGKYLTQAEDDFAELSVLENEIVDINEKIASRLTELSCYNGEIRLSR